jgi:hypothetical protein
MCRVYITSLCLLALVLIGRAQSPYAVAGISDAREVENFLAELQRASRSDDRNAIASLFITRQRFSLPL